MSQPRRIFLPIFGMAMILTLVAISTWISGSRKISDGLVLVGAALLVWVVVAMIRRHGHDSL